LLGSNITNQLLVLKLGLAGLLLCSNRINHLLVLTLSLDVSLSTPLPHSLVQIIGEWAKQLWLIMLFNQWICIYYSTLYIVTF